MLRFYFFFALGFFFTPPDFDSFPPDNIESIFFLLSSIPVMDRVNPKKVWNKNYKYENRDIRTQEIIVVIFFKYFRIWYPNPSSIIHSFIYDFKRKWLIVRVTILSSLYVTSCNASWSMKSVLEMGLFCSINTLLRVTIARTVRASAPAL